MSGIRWSYSRRLALLGAMAVMPLVSPAAASATTPTSLAPASGASFEAENPPTFTATDNPPFGQLYLHFRPHLYSTPRDGSTRTSPSQA